MYGARPWDDDLLDPLSELFSEVRVEVTNYMFAQLQGMDNFIRPVVNGFRRAVSINAVSAQDALNQDVRTQDVRTQHIQKRDVRTQNVQPLNISEIIVDSELWYEQVLGYTDDDVFSFCQELTNRTVNEFLFGGDCPEIVNETRQEVCANNTFGVCANGYNCESTAGNQLLCIHPCYQARVVEERCLFEYGFECSLGIVDGTRYEEVCSCRENFLFAGTDTCLHQDVIIITTSVVGGFLIILIIAIFVVIAYRRRQRRNLESSFMAANETNGLHRTPSGVSDIFDYHDNQAYQLDSESYAVVPPNPQAVNFYGSERDIPSRPIPRPRIRESRDDMTIIPEDEDSEFMIDFRDPTISGFVPNLNAVDLENEYIIQRPAAELIPFYDF